MRIGLALPMSGSVDCRAGATHAERAGFDDIWVSEVAHDPFMACTLASASTSRIGIGTAIAVAFARSPMSVATQAHDLQQLSQGRFTLGLGTQVKAHVTRRFSMPWSSPVERMCEYVAAVRAVWTSWEDGERLDFKGDFYELTLMPPAFVPQPRTFAPPEILLAGVGPRSTTMAGEVADGFLCHSFTTERYLRETTIPSLGVRAEAGSGFRLLASPMIATGATSEELAEAIEAVRGQIAFYGSTPAYRPVLETHGWEQAADELLALSRQGRWGEMGSVVDDEMLRTLAIVAEPREVVAAVLGRFGPPFTGISLYSPHPLGLDTLELIGTTLPSDPAGPEPTTTIDSGPSTGPGREQP